MKLLDIPSLYKPRIRRLRGKWVCKVRPLINGYGSTPLTAYEDWQRRNTWMRAESGGDWVRAFQ